MEILNKVYVFCLLMQSKHCHKDEETFLNDCEMGVMLGVRGGGSMGAIS